MRNATFTSPAVVVMIHGLPIRGSIAHPSLANDVVRTVFGEVGVSEDQIFSIICHKETDGVGRCILVEVLDFRGTDNCFFDRTFKPVRTALTDGFKKIWPCPVFVRGPITS